MKKLDKSKGYGTVAGHDKAVYEQNGILFDGAGDELTPDKAKAVKAEATSRDMMLESAALFLKNILINGPMDRSALYREVEQNNQDWESVKTAAAKLEVRKYKKGSTEMWKLTEAA